MKNKVLLLLLLAAFFSTMQANAQVKRCLTFESIQDFKSKNEDAQTDAAFEGWLSKKIKADAGTMRTLANYTIPIVFHIIHNGEPIGTGSNISAGIIQAQLDQLNADFNNTSGSTYAIAASANIQFSLAFIDPQGRKMPEPGIIRINRNAKAWATPPYDVSTYNSYPDVTIMPATIWNPAAYFNVWVLDIAGNYLGKATFPSFSTLDGINSNSGETDTHAGVLLHYKSVGSKQSPGPYGANGGLGRTLTHETGHFFGLRHIWGDAACGNDYCNDTPVQSKATEECPVGNLANECTPAANKMYENYMDYTFDACVNTFTADQVTRMQTVMLNSPRRKELAQSGTDVVPVVNTVRFENVSFSFSENGVNTTACPAFREIQVPLNLFDAATAEATLHFTSNGTAQEGLDYELLTPTLTFNAGDASKTLLLHIYDDAVAESTENITLQYTISGSGVQAASENQTLTIDISDNDGVTAISSNGVLTLLSEDFDGNTGGNLNTWSTIFFGTQDRINRWTVSSSGTTAFTGQFAHITDNVSTKNNAYSITSNASVGFMTGPIDAKGFSNISLAFKYMCDGELYNGAPYDYGTLFYSLDGVNFQILPNHLDDDYSFLFVNTPSLTQFEQSLGAIFDNQVFYLGFLWENDNTEGSGSGFMIDDIVITGKALSVGQTAGEVGKQNVLTGQSILLKNTASTQLIAKVENATTDLGCVTATITQAGDGRQSITTDAGSFLRTQKVVQVMPEHQTAATVTLYFTAAELAQWGDLKGNLKILKVKDGVSLAGVITASNAEIITPNAVTENAEAGYFAYTFAVNSFSQFMLVSPTLTLPVKLVQFEAKGVNRHIQLDWATADEKENKGFWVEKSNDGRPFEKAGWVAATGNSTYRFTDNLVQPGTVYHYRLQQVDNNGKFTYSGIRQAKIEGIGVTLQVIPNPATDHIKVFVSGSRQPVTIQLLNASGHQVGMWQAVNTFAAPVTIPIGHLPKGIYTILVLLPDGVQSQKIIKQ